MSCFEQYEQHEKITTSRLVMKISNIFTAIKVSIIQMYKIIRHITKSNNYEVKGQKGQSLSCDKKTSSL